MALGIRNRTDLVRERQGFREIFERIEPLEVALFVQLPAPIELCEQLLSASRFQRRHTATAWDTGIVRQAHTGLLGENRKEPKFSNLLTSLQ